MFYRREFSLVKKLVKRGHRVKALVLKGNQKASVLQALGVETVEGDIRDLDSVKKAFSRCEVVFNCAAVVTDRSPKKLFKEMTVGGAQNCW